MSRAWGPSPRLSAGTTQLRKSIAGLAGHGDTMCDLPGLGVDPKTLSTGSEVFHYFANQPVSENRPNPDLTSCDGGYRQEPLRSPTIFE